MAATNRKREMKLYHRIKKKYWPDHALDEQKITELGVPKLWQMSYGQYHSGHCPIKLKRFKELKRRIKNQSNVNERPTLSGLGVCVFISDSPYNGSTNGRKEFE